MKSVMFFAIVILAFYVSAVLALTYISVWGSVFYWMKTIFWFYFTGMMLRFLYNKMTREEL